LLLCFSELQNLEALLQQITIRIRSHQKPWGAGATNRDPFPSKTVRGWCNKSGSVPIKNREALLQQIGICSHQKPWGAATTDRDLLLLKSLRGCCNRSGSAPIKILEGLLQQIGICSHQKPWGAAATDRDLLPSKTLNWPVLRPVGIEKMGFKCGSLVRLSEGATSRASR
jgi:hypothetical protein